MNKKNIYFGSLLIVTLLLSGCASDDASDKTQGTNAPTGIVTFATAAEGGTRTSAKYTGSGLDFYWTVNDKIWAKDDNGNYNASVDNDIATRIAAVPGSNSTAKAKFHVSGLYTGTTHKVRYTGMNGTKDKVVIKPSQTQNTPNDAIHIADDGDFGVADATGSGSYNFTLNHKAAYVTFMPHTTDTYITGAKIKKITLWSGNENDHLAGTFDIDDDGVLSGATSATNRVSLVVNNFPVSATTNYIANAATMVIAPGTYNNVAIEYTLEVPTASGPLTGTITKLYPSVTFDAGKNTPVRTDLKVNKVYLGNEYYQWDAQQRMWEGHEWNNPNPSLRQQPSENMMTTPYTPPSGSSSHYREDPANPSGIYPAANHSAANCPNVNEMIWYCMQGAPHWDIELWVTMGHLYAGGMWFKKKSNIAGFTDTNYGGTDYRTQNPYSTITNNNVIQGKPSDLNNYFYLPALGVYGVRSNSPYLGEFALAGNWGYYWSSTSKTGVGADSRLSAFSIGFNGSNVNVYDIYSREGGFPQFYITNEDEFRPF